MGDQSKYDRLIERAMEEHWPIPAPIRRACLQRMIDLLDPEHPDGQHATERTRTAAYKAILAAQGQDIARLALALRALANQTGSGDLTTLVEEAERMASGYIPDAPPEVADG